MSEKRRATRMEMDAVLKLNSIQTMRDTEGLSHEEFTVNVLNVSTSGVAFKSTQELKLNTYYDLELVLWTKTTFNSVIEVVRMESIGNGDILCVRVVQIEPGWKIICFFYNIIYAISQ